MFIRTSKRDISLDQPLVMGILNVTPDSFSDGGKFATVDAAIDHAAAMIGEGASFIDVGGESTRPGSARVDEQTEMERVVPVIAGIVSRFDIPVSIDTTRSVVAEAAVNAGAEIINDISGLRFDARIADVAAVARAGLILMHSRGEFEAMHSQPPVENILDEVTAGFEHSTAFAAKAGIDPTSIVLDIGIGFGKTIEQNLELIASLDKLIRAFPGFPMLIGVSRKSFIGKLLGGAGPDERSGGSLACTAIAVLKGAAIVRAHDIRETVQAVKLASALRSVTI